MTTASHTKPKLLSIEFNDDGVRFTLSKFHECEGVFCVQGNFGAFKVGDSKAAKLHIEERSEPIWSGVVAIDVVDGEMVAFQLCVLAKLGAEDQRLIQWRQVPSVLSVFGEGYEALSESEAAITLDDLITFHTEANAKVHFELEMSSISVPGVFTEQESIKDLSEVLLTWRYTGEFPKSEQVVVLEIELFEVTHFIIGLVAEADSEGLIFQLTNHFYAQARRIGRRISVEGVTIGNFNVIEISDFGMSVDSPFEAAPPLGSDISLTLPDGGVASFVVIYRKTVAQRARCGLMLLGDSPEQRKAWQNFTLQFQYSLLSTRKPEDHEACWSHLNQSGYLSGTVGEMVKSSRESIFNEWKLIDNIGPDKGISVVGKCEGRCVATIGITRAADTVWVAQAAAVIDDPKFLEYTKSIYGWRTRAILQQPDGMYHLAFFAANKPFLDRFFRKFFLQLPEHEKHLVTWDEWQPSFLKVDHFEPGTEVKASITHFQTLRESYKFFKILSENTKSDLSIKEEAGSIAILGRPHQHLAQFLASVWIPKGATVPLKIIATEYRERGHPFVVLMSEQRDLKDKYREEIEKGLLIEGEDEVVWTCHRSLLPQFLANSLKALQIMVRKYGVRNAA